MDGKLIPTAHSHTFELHARSADFGRLTWLEIMISKRKARRVTIGGTAFRYKVSTTPISRGIYQLNITVQRELLNGSKLVVVGLLQKDITIWPLEDLEQHVYYPTVTRHQIEWLIHQAIGKGWIWPSRGPDFILKVTNEIFRFWFLHGESDGPIPS